MTDGQGRYKTWCVCHEGQGGLRDINPGSCVRAQFLTCSSRQAVFLSGRSARSPPTAQAARPPRPRPTLPPTPNPPNRPRPAGFFAGASNPAPPSRTRVDRRRSDRGGGAHPGAPSPMQAQASHPKRCCSAIARVTGADGGGTAAAAMGSLLVQCSALHCVASHQRPFFPLLLFPTCLRPAKRRPSGGLAKRKGHVL
jgi:hypothetical protein